MFQSQKSSIRLAVFHLDHQTVSDDFQRSDHQNWKSRLLWSRHAEVYSIHHITKPVDKEAEVESRVTSTQLISFLFDK